MTNKCNVQVANTSKSEMQKAGENHRLFIHESLTMSAMDTFQCLLLSTINSLVIWN